MNRALNRWTPPLVVCVLLAAAWLASALASPQINNLPLPPLRAATSATPHDEPSPQESAEASSSPRQETTEVDTPDERTGMIAVAVLFVVLAAGGLIGWIVVRKRAAAVSEPVVVTRRAVPAAAGKTAAAVVEAVDVGILELADTDTDPRKAVIACWVRLERAAAAAGTPRQVGDSPTDLVTRLLQDHSASQDALDALAAVYREARYAAHAIDEAMRSAAVAALRQVRAELAKETRVTIGQRRGGGDAVDLVGTAGRGRQ